MQKVEMYIKRSCGYCFAAKNLLLQNNIPYLEIALDDEPHRMQEMIDRSGRMTVPQVFINGQSIGGFMELNALQQNGELAAVLAAGDEES